jgi:hypothetical protein
MEIGDQVQDSAGKVVKQRINEPVMSKYSDQQILGKNSGRVEGWRGGPKGIPWQYPGFPPSCPFRDVRSSVSSPRHIARSVRFSRTTRSCTLRIKSYEAYRTGAAFDEGT